MSRHSGPRPERTRPAVPRGRLLGLSLGITVTLVAWGFLVYAAIGFGADARGGLSEAWAFLALATVGAAACLFVTLLLGTRVLNLLTRHEPAPPAPPRVPGGRRASR